MEPVQQTLKSLVTRVGRSLEYVLTGESTYRITSSDFKNFDVVSDRFKARMLEESVRDTLTRRFGIRVQAPVLLDLFEADKAPSTGEDCPGHGVVGFYRPHRLRDDKAHVIFILQGMPRGRFKAVYGHELVHAFERETSFLNGNRVLHEGLARWVEYKLLRDEGAVREARKVLNLSRWTWGRGVRIVLALEERVGEKNVVEALRHETQAE
jgi:hypothetical protein